MTRRHANYISRKIDFLPVLGIISETGTVPPRAATPGSRLYTINSKDDMALFRLFYCDLVEFTLRNDMVGTASGSVQTLFDFTRIEQVNNWIEHSDTSKPTGMSKATLLLHKSQLFQRAIFFNLFVPKPNGVGFAGIRSDTNFDLREYHYIAVKCRAQGVNSKYKMVLKHRGLGKDSVVYGQIFTATENEFTTVKLPLEGFKPYYRGSPLPLEDHPLDLSAITNMVIKVDNGPYLPDNHPGVSALELDWIKAVK